MRLRWVLQDRVPPAISITTPTSTSQTVRASSVPLTPSTTATATCLIVVTWEFFLFLVERQYITTTYLDHIKTELASLHGQIRLWVRMTLEATETRIWVAFWDEILEFTDDLYNYIDTFERWVSARFSDIVAPDLGEIWEEVAILRARVHSLTESQILYIPSFIPSFTQLIALHEPRYFYLFMEEEKIVPTIRTKRARMKDI